METYWQYLILSPQALFICLCAKLVHNKWLQWSRIKMICMYKETIDDLIHVFIHIITHNLWLKKWSTHNYPNSTSMKSNAIVRCGDPTIIANAMKYFHGAKDLHTRDCTLEGSELFGSPKQKLDLLSNALCDSHWHDKVNYSIPRPNGCAKMTCIEESLNFAEHGMAHNTLVLETKLPCFTMARC